MIIRTAVIFVSITGLCNAAYAACWKLPNGTIVQTNSNSTPPTKGAKRVMCSKVDSVPVNRPTPKQKPANPPPPPVTRGVVASDQSADQRECVEYARSKVSRLPRGLITIKNKLDIVNSKRARSGIIAIIEVPSGAFAQYGHVAYVEEVTGNSIKISETNYGGRRFQKRTATGRDIADAENQLRIVGYFDPEI